MKTAFFALAATVILVSACQQVPQQGPLMQSSASTVGLGRVPVGAVSAAKSVTFKLDRPGTAQVFYAADPFSGPNADEFRISPATLRSRPVTNTAGLTVRVACKPDGLGQRTAAFAPLMTGAQADQNLLPVKFTCLGIGKTVNPRGPGVKIFNGNGNGAVDFGRLIVGSTARRTVRITNQTTNTFDLRIRWIVGPRSMRAGTRIPAGAGIVMVRNPAPFRNPPTQIRPGQTILVPINFKPHLVDTYDASLEVVYDVPGTRNQSKMLYTYVTGKGIGN